MNDRLYYELIMDATEIAAQNTNCQRKAVGVVILDQNDKIVLQAAFNGSIRPDDAGLCGGPSHVGACGCIHAEIKAMIELAKQFGTQERKFRLLCKYSPCSQCANAIVFSRKIDQVIYLNLTEHDPRGLNILNRYGVCTYQLPETAQV